MTLRVGTCSLGHEQNAAGHENRDDQGGADATEIESSIGNRFGEKIADGRTEWTGEDES